MGPPSMKEKTASLLSKKDSFRLMHFYAIYHCCQKHVVVFSCVFARSLVVFPCVPPCLDLSARAVGQSTADSCQVGALCHVFSRDRAGGKLWTKSQSGWGNHSSEMIACLLLKKCLHC